MNDSGSTNPYTAPAARKSWRRPFSMVALLLQIVGVIFFLNSLSYFWSALELANQEHLHLWRSGKSIYGIEINGQPSSIDEAIRWYLFLGLEIFLIALGLFAVSRFISRRKAIRQGSK